MEKISELLIAWYAENKRDLPWRMNRDAYRVWISEIMLQQTRVEAVKPYYEVFLAKYPDVLALANADDDELSKVWEGLGYYSRVRNMKKAAMQCVSQYGAKLPNTYEELLTLSGIGPYTAAAIASIAYRQQVCAIDGNLMRVYARLFAFEKDILLPQSKQAIQALMEQDLAQDMGIMNQALMDLGASICLPNGNPRCNICPLQHVCKAYACGKQNTLPIRIKKQRRKQEKYSVLVYECKGQFLLHKREDKGLLAGLYEFVLVDTHKTKKDFDQAISLGRYKHIFSHKEWNMKGFLIQCDTCFEKEGYFWCSKQDIENKYSIPSAFQYYKNKVFEILE